MKEDLESLNKQIDILSFEIMKSNEAVCDLRKELYAINDLRKALYLINERFNYIKSIIDKIDFSVKQEPSTNYLNEGK